MPGERRVGGTRDRTQGGVSIKDDTAPEARRERLDHSARRSRVGDVPGTPVRAVVLAAEARHASLHLRKPGG